MNEAPLQRPVNDAGKRASIALAVAVHLVLAGFLIYGVRWQTSAPAAVEVELVSAVPMPAAAAPAPPIEPPPKPVPEPRPEPKPDPKPAPPPPKPDIAIKEKEKPKELPKPKPDPFQEALRKESERVDQQKKVDTALKEHQLAQEARTASARNKAINDYLGRIRGKIRGNIVLPPEVKGNPEAVFDVVQLPSGEIVTVKLKRSSGMPALDAAIERAILKSSPLPKPEQGDLFSRSLELKFRPLED